MRDTETAANFVRRSLGLSVACNSQCISASSSSIKPAKRMSVLMGTYRLVLSIHERSVRAAPVYLACKNNVCWELSLACFLVLYHIEYGLQIDDSSVLKCPVDAQHDFQSLLAFQNQVCKPGQPALALQAFPQPSDALKQFRL